MNLGEIIAVNFTAVTLLIILLISRHMTKRNRRAADKLFTAIIIIGIAGPVLETFSFIIDGKGGAFLRVINIIDNSLLYACTATVAVAWVWYVYLNLYRDTKKIKKKFMPMVVIWGALLVTLFINPFTGFLFKVDENNVYTRQPVGYIFYAFLISSYIISLIMYYKFRHKHGETQFFPIWMFLTPLFIACIVQMIFYGLSAAWVGCAVGLIGIYMNIQSKLSLVDSLTGLYNRAYIEHKLIVARGNQKYAYGGIMLDMDEFKQINDTYGHSAGDNALIDVAKILNAASNRSTLAFRFAGDEFIVLVRSDTGNADELEEKTKKIKERIIKEAEKFNENSKSPYKIAFSMGHALYDTSVTDDVFFHNMDMEMYKDKERHRALRNR